MKEFLSEINNWIEQKKRFAVATVIQTWGSAPRPVGSCMLIGENMEMVGSVSGGCVEGAVVREAVEIIETRVPKVLSYGITDEEAWEVGLSCGGAIKVFVEPFLGEKEPQTWEILRGRLENNEGCVLLLNLQSATSEHILVVPKKENTSQQGLISEAQRAFSERKTQIVETEEGAWFAQVFPSKERLIIVGAAHITVDLVHLAHYFGFETLVIDPRGIFADKTQFTTAPNQLANDWPAEILPEIVLDDYTFCVLLTHDPKIDDQALDILLKSPVAYIGALGSKKTHEKRIKRLTEKGFSESEITRIHAPIGVDIRAKSAREIALSIIAELIKVKNQY